MLSDNIAPTDDKKASLIDKYASLKAVFDAGMEYLNSLCAAGHLETETAQKGLDSLKESVTKLSECDEADYIGKVNHVSRCIAIINAIDNYVGYTGGES